MKDALFAELDDHLNNGCVDSRCRYFPNKSPEFDDLFIEHLVEVVMEVMDEN